VRLSCFHHHPIPYSMRMAHQGDAILLHLTQGVCSLRLGNLGKQSRKINCDWIDECSTVDGDEATRAQVKNEWAI
jgi:hypothetical protein